MRKSVFLVAIILAVQYGQAPSAVSSDSVSTLERTIASLPRDASILEVPEGVYTIGSTWTISRSGVTIHGAGPGKTVLIRDPKFDGVLVRMNAEGSTLSNLTVDGNGTRAVLFLNQGGITADTLEVKNFTHIGIAVPARASGCRITNCIISGPSSQTTMAVWRDAGPSSTDVMLTIDHNIIKNSGLYATGGQITITNNQISGEPNPGGGQMDIGNAFTRNTVALISGNSILDGGTLRTGGIEMGGGSFTVTNNIIRNHGLGGIGVGHNVIRAKITGNVISNSGHDVTDRNRPQCRSAIYVGYGATNVEISGNRCFDDQPAKTQTYGVILVPPPSRPDPRFPPKQMEHIVVKDNDLRGNLHPEGLLDESGARDRLISANLADRRNR